MLAADACAQFDPAPRLLNRKTLEAALGRFRLPAYSTIHWLLGDVRNKANIIYLWDEVFGEVPDESTFDLECMFAGRVNNDLFCVDLFAMDDIFNSGENPLDYPILTQGFGVPWEVADFPELAECILPVLAIVANELPLPGYEREEGEWDSRPWDEGFFFGIEEWLAMHGRNSLPDWRLPTGLEGIKELQDALRLLPFPADALADVVSAILKDTGNRFLDYPNYFWRMEYGYDDEYYWTPDDIDQLAEEFEPVRDACERLIRYNQWYHAQERGHAAGHVLAILEPLIAGGWTIQDGEVIFYE